MSNVIQNTTSVAVGCLMVAAMTTSASPLPQPAEAQISIVKHPAHTAERDPSIVSSATPEVANATGQPLVAAGSWKALGPYGGSVRAIAVSPLDSNLVLAGTGDFASYGGVFRSADGGSTWSNVADIGGINGIADIAFSADGTAFAGVENRDVWRSTDGGLTWTPLEVPGPTNALAIDPTDPTHLLVASGGLQALVWRSRDTGNSWQAVDLQHPIYSTCTQVVFDPDDPNSIIAAIGSPSQIWATTDGGTSWLMKANFFRNIDDMVHDGAQLLVAGRLGLLASRDQGLTWQTLSGAWPSQTTKAIAVDPGNSKVLFAGSEAGVHRSLDGGATWDLGISDTEQLTVDAMVVVPNDSSNILMGAEVFGFYQSFDGGTTFSHSSHGMTSFKVMSVAVNPQDPTHFAAAFESQNAGGIFVSTDNGTRWTLDGNFAPARVPYVAFSPTGVLYAVHDGPTSIGAQEGVYRRNTDGTWTGLGPDQGPGNETTITMLRFSTRDPDLILAAGGDKSSVGWGATIWRSSDAGASWSKAYEGNLEREFVRDLEILDGSDREMVAVVDVHFEDMTGGVLRSSNGGTSWFPSNSGLPADFKGRAICSVGVEPNRLLAAHRDARVPPETGSLFESVDGGANWAPIGVSGTFMDLVCSPENSAQVYGAFASGDLVMRSDDLGRSFSAFDRGLETAGRGWWSTLEEGVRMSHSESGPARLVLSSLTGVYISELVAELFSDGFESRSLDAWSSSQP